VFVAAPGSVFVIITVLDTLSKEISIGSEPDAGMFKEEVRNGRPAA
jgi:hypothetical protein